MFGTNEIVGKKFFKDQAKNTLMVTSRFFTLQGEGPYRGEPAVFVRLAKCNLACSFCDTYFDSGSVMTFDEIFADLSKVIGDFYTSRGIDLATPLTKEEARARQYPFFVLNNIGLVISGGEPSLQPNLKAFLEEAKHRFKWRQIESNGISVAELDIGVTYVVSPKCNEKDGVAMKYLKPNPDMLRRANCLKFVMSAPENETFTPYSEIPDWALEWKALTGKQVFVSPMNMYLKAPEAALKLRAIQKTSSIEDRSTKDEVVSWWEPGLFDMKKNQRNHEYAAEYCMKHGLTFNMQQHLFAGIA